MKKIKLFIAIALMLAAIVVKAQSSIPYPVVFDNTIQINKEKTTVNASRLCGISPAVGVGGNFATYVTIGSGLTLSNDVLSASGTGSVDTTNFWNIRGNAITGGTKYIGTTNNRSLNFRTNGAHRMKLDSLGNLGIGYTFSTALRAKAQINGSFYDSTRVGSYEYILNSGVSNRLTLMQGLYTINTADTTIWGLFYDNSVGGKVIAAWQDLAAPTVPENGLLADSSEIRICRVINNTTILSGVRVNKAYGVEIRGESAANNYGTAWVDAGGTVYAAVRNKSLGIGTQNPDQKLTVVGSAIIDSALAFRQEYFTDTDSTFTIPNNITSVIAYKASSDPYVSGTITFPATPIDGQVISIAGSYTAVTLNGNGNTIRGAATAISAATAIRYRFRNSTWYPF